MSNVSTFMGKIAAAMFAVALASGIAGCGAGGATASGSSSSTKTAEQAEPTSVTIQGYNANKELVDVEVPYNPARVVVLDMAALDILDSLGVGDKGGGFCEHLPGVPAGLRNQRGGRQPGHHQRGRP